MCRQHKCISHRFKIGSLNANEVIQCEDHCLPITFRRIVSLFSSSTPLFVSTIWLSIQLVNHTKYDFLIVRQVRGSSNSSMSAEQKTPSLSKKPPAPSSKPVNWSKIAYPKPLVSRHPSTKFSGKMYLVSFLRPYLIQSLIQCCLHGKTKDGSTLRNSIFTSNVYDTQFHSDSERGLGSVVAGLSLGSPALMHFRLHAKHEPNKENRKIALSFVLRHVRTSHGSKKLFFICD